MLDLNLVSVTLHRRFTIRVEQDKQIGDIKYSISVAQTGTLHWNINSGFDRICVGLHFAVHSIQYLICTKRICHLKFLLSRS